LIPTAITAGASRVASGPLCLHAVATTPAGPMEPIRSLLLHRLRPSPDNSWVGSCINIFEACSAFTRVTTCRLTKSPYATLYTGGSGGFVVSTAAPIVTGWSDPVPGRVYLPLWSSAFHGALSSPVYNSYEFLRAGEPGNWMNGRACYCNFEYSVLACFRICTSGSASFQSARKS
jgi:hypothetical protein